MTHISEARTQITEEIEQYEEDNKGYAKKNIPNSVIMILSLNISYFRQLGALRASEIDVE